MRHRPHIEIVNIDLSSVAGLLERIEAEQPTLADDEIARAKAMKDPAMAASWRAARIAARLVLERWVGPSIRRQPFVIEFSGRPVLPNHPPYFSISHSEGRATIAVSTGPVGLDIEANDRHVDMAEPRKQRLVASAEKLAGPLPAHLTGDERVIQAWVRLESVAKADGAGIGALLTKEGISGGRHDTEDGEDADPSEFLVHDVSPGPGFLGAVAAPLLPDDVRVTQFPMSEAALRQFLSETPMTG